MIAGDVSLDKRMCALRDLRRFGAGANRPVGVDQIGQFFTELGAPGPRGGGEIMRELITSRGPRRGAGGST